MVDFFSLTTPQKEDKIIGRLERIFADTMIIGNGGSLHNLTTKSKAPKQKIKFFFDAMEVRVFGPDYDPVTAPDDYEDIVLRIGKWVEMEDREQGVHFNSAGFFYWTYECQGKAGAYQWRLVIEQNNMPLKEVLSFYISAVSFSDSFVKPVSGWFDPSNPANLLDRVEPEIQPGLPDGAELDDFLVEGENGPEWKNGEEVVPFLPYPTVADPDATPEPLEARRGVVNIDGQKMLLNSDGTIEPNIDHDTLYYDPDDQSPTFGMLKAKSGSSLDYSLEEQDTGVKWVDGKSIYQCTWVDISNNTLLISSGVDKIVKMDGSMVQDNSGYMNTVGTYINANSIFRAVLTASSGGVTAHFATAASVVNNTLTLYYTKR